MNLFWIFKSEWKVKSKSQITTLWIYKTTINKNFEILQQLLKHTNTPWKYQ